MLFVPSMLYLILRERSEIKDYLLLKAGNYSPKTFIWGCIWFNLLFIFIAERARDQYGLRYAIVCIPFIPLFISMIPQFFKQNGLLKIASTVSMLTMLSLYGSFQYYKGQKMLTSLHAEILPNENIKLLASSQECDVFLAGYWETYPYQYFLQGEKEFIVGKGQDRTPTKTKRLNRAKYKRCKLNEKFKISYLPTNKTK